MNSNSEIINWVTDALSGMGSRATPLAESDATPIVALAEKTFVIGKPTAWWMNLKGEFKTYGSETTKLEEILPSIDESYWFIPETEESALSVFDLTLPEIKQVINQCPFFEYNILNKNMKWLAAESDHNEFYIVLPKGNSA